jgi:hypothetical protein
MDSATHQDRRGLLPNASLACSASLVEFSVTTSEAPLTSTGRQSTTPPFFLSRQEIGKSLRCRGRRDHLRETDHGHSRGGDVAMAARPPSPRARLPSGMPGRSWHLSAANFSPLLARRPILSKARIADHRPANLSHSSHTIA